MIRGREELAAFTSAVGLLTRWPIRSPASAPGPSPADSPAGAHPAAAVRYYPLVGALVGAFAAGVFWIAHLVFPTPLAVVLSTAATLLATGALHEDGFADTCDGLGGGATRERALAIMRDSRIGTYGAAGLGLLLAAKVLALAAMPADAIPWLLVSGHAASRASVVLAVAMGPGAREDGLGARLAGSTPPAGSIAFALLTAAAALSSLFAVAAPAVVLAGLAGLAGGHLVIRRAYERKLGGYTGDCLGAVQQMSELGMYLGVLAAIPAS